MKHFAYKVLESTNDKAKQLARENPELLDAGFSVVAERQTAGKGRRGRQWYSGSKGGLYYTAAIRSAKRTPRDVQHLSERIGKGVAAALKTRSQRRDIDWEWPNDITLGYQKLGGILIETVQSADENSPTQFYIGIGLNLNQRRFPEDLAILATSIWRHNKATIEKSDVIADIEAVLKQTFKAG